MSADTAYTVNTSTGETIKTGDEGGDKFDVVTFWNGECDACVNYKSSTRVYFNEEPLKPLGPPATGAVTPTDSPLEWILELPKKAVIGLLGMMLLKEGGEKVVRTTVIGKMDDIAKYTDDVYDTWWKSGRMGGAKVTWKENKAWLDARIARGDKFMLATDPTTLPSTVLKIGQEIPRGYFTARELKYLKSKGVQVLNSN